MCGCPWNTKERAGASYVVYACLRPGVSFEAAEADMKRVATEIAAEQPRTHRAYAARLFDLRETVIHDIRPTLLLLFAAAGTPVPDHVRQCRRAAAGAVRRAGARNGHARRAGSKPGAARGALSRGRRADIARRCCGGRAAGADNHAGHRVARRQLSAHEPRSSRSIGRFCCSRWRPLVSRAFSRASRRCDRPSGPRRLRFLAKVCVPRRAAAAGARRSRSSLPRLPSPFPCWRSVPC